jgi:hypothetical protein
MNQRFLAIGLSLMFAVVLYAQKKEVKLTGNLIDNMCASHHVNDKDFGDRVKNHTTSCALMPNCKGSGYAVYSDNKLYKLDEAGNKIALEILEDTQTKKDLRVSVEGTLEGDTIHVTKLTEVTDTSSQ